MNIELLEEMRRAAKAGELKTLTMAALRDLQGVCIQTIYFGYNGQDGVDEFIPGKVISDWEAGRTVEYEGYESLLDYREANLSERQIKNLKNRNELYTTDGRGTNMIDYGLGVFTCSDADRRVLYRVKAPDLKIEGYSSLIEMNKDSKYFDGGLEVTCYLNGEAGTIRNHWSWGYMFQIKIGDKEYTLTRHTSFDSEIPTSIDVIKIKK